MSNNKCPVCDEDVVKGSKDVTEMIEKGIVGLIKASQERKDEKHRIFRGLTSLLIHANCRKNYTRVDTIHKDVRNASTSQEEAGPSQLRSSAPQFDFKSNCFLCGYYVQEKTKTPHSKRRTVHKNETLTLQCRIREVCSMRKDSWGDAVLGRLSSINDLVAEGAVYHKDCHNTFVKPINFPCSKAESKRFLNKWKVASIVSSLKTRYWVS